MSGIFPATILPTAIFVNGMPALKSSSRSAVRRSSSSIGIFLETDFPIFEV